MLKGKRILVTGGAGFIGSHLVDRLCVDNEVTVLDNLSTGSLKNLERSKGLISFVHGNVLDRQLVETVVDGTEIVFHLAAISSVAKLDSALRDVNVLGTINLLTACRNVERFVFASSVAVYGETNGCALEGSVLKPLSLYGFSKLMAENQCLFHCRRYGVPVVVLRYCNVYGARGKSGEYADLVSKAVKALRLSERLVVYGDGNQTRDFIYVGDVVEATILSATQDVGETFNVGTGEAVSVNEVIRALSHVAGRSPMVAYAKARAMDVRQSRVSTSKLFATGYAPRIVLEDGLRLVWRNGGR